MQVLRADAYRWAERGFHRAQNPVNLFLSPPFPTSPRRADDFLKLVQTLLEKAPDETVLAIQAEDGFPMERLPDLDLWDVRHYGRNMLLFRVKGEERAEKPSEG